jgi:hypothetical protein
MDPEWHEAMVYTNIDLFEMSYEESISCFKFMESLEKIKCTNGLVTMPVDIKKSVTSSVGKSSLRILSHPTGGVTIVTRTTTTPLIAE